jgi:tRNA-Thr(GGU) m(6)t(6)A37 methyltransferase TsaA
MGDDEWTLRPVGTIRTEFTRRVGTPIQSAVAPDSRGTVEVFPEFEEALQDLEGFSHLFLIYIFHRAGPATLRCIPYLDDTPRGVFATRAPSRPNPIGLSVVRLLERQGNILKIAEVDILDGTPLLDIKPFVPHYDHRDQAAVGWLSKRLNDCLRPKADDRFGE